MKVGMMARSLRPPMTGIGRYTQHLARAISGLLGRDQFTLFLTREVKDLTGIDCGKVVAALPTPHEALRAIWEQTSVPRAVRRHEIDVYHSPNHTLPLKLSCPSVVTIHDLSFMDPRFHKTRVRLYLQLLTKLALRRADHVIAVSQYTRQQLERQFPFLAGRVTVVHSGVDSSFFCSSRDANLRETNGNAKPYVLFVGSIEPRKNLPRLIRAFELAMSTADLPHDLVLCGPWGWRYKPVVEAWQSSPLRERIRHTGYVPAGELPAMYSGADLLVYPSLDEGFGFPVLESMASGTPVVTSDCASLPEVAGDAAMMVPPSDESAIAEAIKRVLTDRRLASDLVERGRRRAASFTWERTASDTLGVYQRVMEQ